MSNAPQQAAIHRAPPLRLAVLISGGGRTLENVATAIARGELNATIALVISSRPGVKGLERAAKLNLPTVVVARKEFADTEAFSAAIWQHIRTANAQLVCLAGFLSLITIPPDFKGRVINVHPALLPAFGGKGMYGHHVHEAVIAAGCKLSGCTVHFADDTYDTGPIIAQRACAVAEDDTPDTLAARVFEEECLAYTQALRVLCDGRAIVHGRRVRIVPDEADIVERAKHFCMIAHEGQLRVGGQPYASHPMAVSNLVREQGVTDPQILAAACLHDVLEDTGVSHEQLERCFSPRVAALVAEVTIPPEAEKPFERKQQWLLEHARKLSPGAKWIKMADRAHNMSELGSRPADKRLRYAKATVDLLEALKPWPNEAIGRMIEKGIAKYLSE